MQVELFANKKKMRYDEFMFQMVSLLVGFLYTH